MGGREEREVLCLQALNTHPLAEKHRRQKSLTEENSLPRLTFFTSLETSV